MKQGGEERNRKYRPGAGLRTLIINSGGSLLARLLRYLVLWETNCPADAVIAYEPDADCASLTLLILVQVGTILLWLQGRIIFFNLKGAWLVTRHPLRL